MSTPTARTPEARQALEETSHPFDPELREDRIPHIWCPGCGIGSVLQAFLEAVDGTGIDRDRLAVVSGIGCTGRVAGYLNADSFHTTHGRPIPFATGLKLARPEMVVSVVSGASFGSVACGAWPTDGLIAPISTAIARTERTKRHTACNLRTGGAPS